MLSLNGGGANRRIKGGGKSAPPPPNKRALKLNIFFFWIHFSIFTSKSLGGEGAGLPPPPNYWVKKYPEKTMPEEEKVSLKNSITMHWCRYLRTGGNLIRVKSNFMALLLNIFDDIDIFISWTNLQSLFFVHFPFLKIWKKKLIFVYKTAYDLQ